MFLCEPHGTPQFSRNRRWDASWKNGRSFSMDGVIELVLNFAGNLFSK
jgi:hypothetical protein